MTKSKLFLFAATVGMLLVGRAHAFSLLGPYDTWQTANLGYNIGLVAYSLEGDSGGPMNLGEEYRLTSPIITYSFDESFREYFGAAGVAAIEAAFKTLNDLPAQSQTDANLTPFARNTARYNAIASQLGMLDLKSTALSSLLEMMGLAAPERYTYTLRSQVTVGTQLVNTVVNRNFDPFTFLPSSRVNGTLYTYQTVHYLGNVDFWDAMEIPVDTSDPALTVISFANVQAGMVGSRIFSPLYATRGLYYTGLTKDDVGALRYIYSPGNVNLETPPGDVLLTAQNSNSGAGVIDLNALLNSQVWRLVINGSLVTATTGTTGGTTGTTTTPGSTVLAGTLVPFPYGTLINVDNTGAGTTTGGGTGTTASNVVTQITGAGYRGGVDKIRFVNVDRYYDPLLMVTTNGYVVTYDDNVVATNGVTVKQRLGRLQARPDIVISANDLGVDNVGNPYLYARTFADGTSFANTSAGSGGFAHAGPGIIDPSTGLQLALVFSKLGNYYLNVGQSSQASGIPGYMWGSFDGASGSSSSNMPAIFPPQIDLKSYAKSIFGN